MQAQIETITPEVAAIMLRANTRNRKLTNSTVATYASAIQRGEWVVNGEPIIFDHTGTLADGQHRLKAVVRAGRPIQALVVRGVAPEAFATLDSGKKRSVSDVLSIAGVKYASLVAIGARAVMRLQGEDTKARMTTPQIMRTVDLHPGLHRWSAKYGSGKIRSFMPSPFIGVATLAEELHDTQTVEEFWTRVESGAGLSATDPAHLLRERFIGRSTTGYLSQDTSLGLMVKAINAHIKGTPITFLRMGKKDALPELVTK